MSDIMKHYDEIVWAVTEDAENPEGWLSDAQDAILGVYTFYGNVDFCGEGSIDVGHLVSLVLDNLRDILEDEEKEEA